MRLRPARRPLAVGIAALACLGALAPDAPAARRPAELDAGRVAGALAARPLRRIGGGTLGAEALRGRAVVLGFWASWCGPCRRELPRLAALQRELAPSGGLVVAVSIDHDARNAADFARRHAPGLAAYHDGPDGLARALDLPALPYTIVLGRDGAVVWAGGGADDRTMAELGARARRAAAAAPSAGPTEGGDR